MSSLDRLLDYTNQNKTIMQKARHLFYSFVVYGENYSGKFVLDKRYTEYRNTSDSTVMWTNRILLKNGTIAVIEIETVNDWKRRRVKNQPSLRILDSSLKNQICEGTLHWRVEVAEFDHKFGSFYELQNAIERMASESYMSMCHDDSGVTFTNYDYDGYENKTEAWQACKKDKHELTLLKSYLRKNFGIKSKRVCYNGTWEEGVLLNIDFADNLHLIAS